MKLESLEELRVFAQIVESGSLTAAASALGMPANTVSRRLASLEERLGVQLLYRTTRSMSLSESGRTLLPMARRILDEVCTAELGLQRESEGLTGVVRISVPSVLTRDMFLSMGPLLEAHPGLRLQIEINDRPVNPITAGLDLVIIGGVLSDSNLIARKLAELHLVAVASTAYLERHGTPRVPEDLRDHRMLHFKSNPPRTQVMLYDGEGRQVVVPATGQVEIDDARGLLDAARSGLGILMTSPRVLRSAPELVRILPDHIGFTFAVYAIYPTSGQRSARLQAVVEALRQTLSEGAT